MSNNGYLTIKEASKVFEINQSTIYKYIKQGRIQSESFSIGGVKIKKVRKLDLETTLTDKAKRILQVESKSESLLSNRIPQGETDSTKQIIPVESLKDTLKEVVRETISEERTQLMKPIEEQSLYRLGSMEKENLFLRAKVESLHQELEQYKALPSNIKDKEQEIIKLQEIHKQELEETEAQLIREREELKSKLKAEEEEKARLIAEAESEKNILKEETEELKKRIQELKKPWWKKIFKK